MALQTVAGSQLFIGSAVAAPSGDVALADFSGATWVEVKGWATAGNLGDTVEAVSQSLIGQNRMRMTKGIRTGGTMENTFIPISSDPGQIKMATAVNGCTDYQFKVQWGAGCSPVSVVTITIASPGVVTWAGGHGLEAGSTVTFATTGSLPTGLVAATPYYVLATGLTATTFQLSATPGGTAIVTTGTQTGVHTATGIPVSNTNYFVGLPMPGQINGGDANAVRLRTWSIAVDSNIVEV